MIDWAKLKPYKSDSRKSFEMLCYVIAKREYENKGEFSSIDDSGGGDGVEFYLTLKTGKEIGWQAKFFPANARLNHGGRKKQIVSSLKRSCYLHPHLKEWILCTNSKFTKEELEYFKKVLLKEIPEGMNVKLVHWNENDFIYWTSQNKYSGIRNYFFGELEFDMDWIKNTFNNQLSIVKDKYEKNLHVETNLEEYIDNIVVSNSFKEKIMIFIKELNDILIEFNKELLLDLTNQALNKTLFEAKNLLIEFSNSLKVTLMGNLSFSKLLLDKIEYFKTQDFINITNSKFNLELDKLKYIIEEFFKKKLNYVKDGDITLDLIGYYYDNENRWDYMENTNLKATSKLCRDIDYYGDILYRRIEKLNSYWDLLKLKNINILSAAGKGKTHLSCRIVEKNILESNPAIYVSGQKFLSDINPLNQLLTILDVPSNYNFKDFIEALDILAESHDCKIPIIIDGLNEITINGRFHSQLLKNNIPNLVSHITNSKNIILITTCRQTYKDAIWKNEYDNFYYLYGYNPEEVKIAVARYFKEYKINATNPLRYSEYFENPLYLKIFCETKNKNKFEYTEVFIGDESIYEIFDQYLKICNKNILKTLSHLDPHIENIGRDLEEIGKHLWKSNNRYISYEAFAEIIEPKVPDYIMSKTKAIQDENLVIMRNWTNEKEYIQFTYDKLAGFIIAKSIIGINLVEFSEFINSKEIKEKLFSKEKNKLHPLYDDILSCLSALLPQNYCKYIHEIIEDEGAFSYSIKTFFEISPQLINSTAVSLVTKLFTFKDNINRLFDLSLSILLHLNHPLNINFWSEQLKNLSMGNRDVYWTEFLRTSSKFNVQEVINELEFNSKKNISEFDDYLIQTIHLQAKLVMWFLTSTVRKFRDTATRSLYYYGRKFPNEFYNLLLYSFDINDPYINERMLAALYGICMARHYELDGEFVNEFLIPKAKEIYSNMFKKNAKYSTTHILKREYAFRILELALYHKQDLFSELQKRRIFPPFKDGGIRKWYRSKKFSKYGGGNSPLNMDFENYTIGRLVKKRNNYDYNNLEYQKVVSNILWRIKNLGYTSELFEEIDNDIVRMQSPSRNESHDVDRYGKKYSWIAYYEMAGYRDDKGLLEEDFKEPRIYDVDIDPSFPENKNEFQLVKQGLLGNRKWSIKKWILNGGLPKIKPYLRKRDILGQEGNWILLNGYINQENNKIRRNRFTFIRSFMIKESSYYDFLKRLKKQNIGGRWLKEIPDDHHTFAGEIPWCNIFPENGLRTFEFELNRIKMKIIKPQYVLTKNGKRISKLEEENFWNDVKDRVIPTGEVLIKINIVGEKDFLKNKLKENNYRIKKIMKTEEIDDFITEKYKVRIPVVNIYSSSSFNKLYRGDSVNILSKEICRKLNLITKPQSFDLFDSSGNIASINLGYAEDKYSDSQHFTYLRKDLLDEYLKKTKSKLIWTVWGERVIKDDNHKKIEEASLKGFAYKEFSEVITY